jgi:hypothetical protein
MWRRCGNRCEGTTLENVRLFVDWRGCVWNDLLTWIGDHRLKALTFHTWRISWIFETNFEKISIEVNLPSTFFRFWTEATFMIFGRCWKMNKMEKKIHWADDETRCIYVSAEERKLKRNTYANIKEKINQSKNTWIIILLVRLQLIIFMLILSLRYVLFSNSIQIT